MRAEALLTCSSATNTPEMNLCLMKIRESGNKGLSAKSIRHHLGGETSQPALRKALEALEKSGQIEQFKSIHVSLQACVRNPSLKLTRSNRPCHCSL